MRTNRQIPTAMTLAATALANLALTLIAGAAAPIAPIVSLTGSHGGDFYANGMVSLTNGSGITKTNAADPATWSFNGTAYGDEWMASYLAAAGNSKVAWGSFDLGVSKRLVKLWLFNNNYSGGTSGVAQYNLYYTDSPAVALPAQPAKATYATTGLPPQGDYNFTSGGWTKFNTSGALNATKAGINSLDLTGISARYLAVEILSNHGDTYQGGRVGFDEVAVTVFPAYPSLGVGVPGGNVNLTWTNLLPNTGTAVYVDVWFGTNPAALTKVAAAGVNTTNTTVSAPSAGTYYWRVDSFLDGTPTGTPVQSELYSFVVNDSDGDGLPDSYELAYTSPASATSMNPGDDSDSDGLTNLQEYQRGTLPNNPDSDGDTLNDGPEVTGAGARPATDPLKADTDGDSLNDGVESNTGTWAGVSNTGTNPIIADTDADALKDGLETNTGTYVSVTNTGTNPLSSDTDGDGAGDWYEITASFTSPFNAAEKPNIPYPLPDPDSSTGATDKKVKVYIMSGQSNMLGIGTVNGTGDGTLETMTRRQNKFPNLVDSSGNYIPRQDVRYRGVISGIANGPLAPGQGSNSSNIGPELGFGQVMGWYHSEAVLLIKSSIGNRGLGWDILPPGSVRYTYGANTYPAYGESPSTIPLSSTSWNTASGSEGPNIWFAGKQFDDYFVHESDMGARPWVAGTAYPASCQIKHNGVPYISTVAHTASAATQPGVGANWATCWSPYSITNVVDVLDNWTAEYGGTGKPFAGRDFEIAGFVWWQGEKDGGDIGHATRYEQNLVKLITSLRTYYTNRYPGKVVLNAPFVLATLGEAALSNTSPAEEVAVRKAHFAVDSATGSNPQINVKTVYSYPLSEGGSGNGHYNNRAGTYMLVGDALGRAMVDLESAASSGNTFANWMTSYGVAPGLAGFAQDADGDGIKNGVENFFGTAPNASSRGLISGVTSGNTFVFTHPQNATPADGVTAAYRWSKDLTTFRSHGQTDGDNTTVNFNAVTSAGITTVTATVTGTATAKLFVDVKVTQN